MDIAVAEYPEHGAVVVAIAGQCDVDSVARLHDTFRDLLRRAVDRIVVDLSGLHFCDSTGLSTLVLAYNASTATGGWVRLAGPRPFLVRVLAVVGLLGRVPTYESVAAALAGDPDGLLVT